jgi:hypothetical protein
MKPIEIKYYYFIPLFALIVSKIQKKYYICLDIILFIPIYIILRNRNSIIDSCADFAGFYFGKFAGYYFVIFYLGSILATFYFQMKKSDLFKYTESVIFKLIIFMITTILYSIGSIIWSCYFNRHILCIFVKNKQDLRKIEYYRTLSSFYWTIVMGFMLLGAPNHFTNLFNLKILKYAGKFSFGLFIFFKSFFNTLFYFN